MKKKLIITLAMLAIVSSFVMAAKQKVTSSGEDGVVLPDFTTNLSAEGGESTSVVADAENVDFIFTLEAQNGSAWVDANGQQVFDADWDVRDGFNVDFRVKAIAGSSNSAQTIKVNVQVGNLFREGATNSEWSNYYNAGQGILSSVYGNSGFDSLASTVGSKNGNFTFSTKANRYYATDPGTVNFKLAYGGDEEAPAGRYESDVTISYSVQ